MCRSVKVRNKESPERIYPLATAGQPALWIGSTRPRKRGERTADPKRKGGQTTAGAKCPSLEALLASVRACRVCEAHLPLGPRPVLRASATARILIVGQAPGARVHKTGIPWDDASGERLRCWMGVSKDVFYDESRIAIIPMGYCYPGRDKSGDLPPRRECADLWLEQLLARLPLIELTLLVGRHAQRHFLGSRCKPSLAETTKAWAEYAPAYVPLPHPSPRNTPWLLRNSGFERHLLPELRKRICALLVR
jgi:uracil-DNA glycosylase